MTHSFFRKIPLPASVSAEGQARLTIATLLAEKVEKLNAYKTSVNDDALIRGKYLPRITKQLESCLELNAALLKAQNQYPTQCSISEEILSSFEEILMSAISQRCRSGFSNRWVAQEAFINTLNTETDLHSLIRIIANTLKNAYQQYPHKQFAPFTKKAELFPIVRLIDSENAPTPRLKK
ncbi:MAG: hypothetical protein H0W64_01585 [Gammaproteobacteria bacterium]|nr:hypothetical protein [Gammaproteobacteria bacterium]